MRKNTLATLHISLCLGLLYLSWGGSFLGIKLVLTGFPPVFQSGIRLCCAGMILLALFPLTKHGRPVGIMEVVQWGVFAFFIMFLNNVCQAVGQESVPSGVTALLYGCTPLCMVLGGWLALGEGRPSTRQAVGIAGATLGVGILVLTGEGLESSVAGTLIILLGVLCFVAGSLYAKRFLVHSGFSAYGGTALAMLLGGLQCLLASWGMGEDVTCAGLTAEALGGMAFLTLFTSIFGYLCYYWLLSHTRTLVAVSFAYIDPVIAVVLGALFGGEALTPRVVLACALIVCSVVYGLFVPPHTTRPTGRESTP